MKKIELTDSPKRKEVEKVWATDDLVYKGSPFFDAYVEELGEFALVLGIGNTVEWEEEYQDEETGEWCSETEYETISGQESYLGYIPSEDKFITGWDMWGLDDISGVVKFSLISGVVRDLEVQEDYNRMMYGVPEFSRRFKRVNYEKLNNLESLEKDYPDIIHLRLD